MLVATFPDPSTTSTVAVKVALLPTAAEQVATWGHAALFQCTRAQKPAFAPAVPEPLVTQAARAGVPAPRTTAAAPATSAPRRRQAIPFTAVSSKPSRP